MSSGHSTLARVLALALLPVAVANADTTPQTPPVTQAWTNTALITTDGVWTNVPGFIGHRGDDITTSTGVDPQTLLADGTATPINVEANETNPNAFATGGNVEYEIANPSIALQGSGTADAPFLDLNLNTTSQQSITVAFDGIDLDGSGDNAAQPIALHYRVGTTGAWTNVPAGFIADATAGPTLAGLTTARSAVLPAAANNIPVLQIRWMTTNAVGNDEGVAIDNISVTGSPIGDTAPTVTGNTPANGAIDIPITSNVSVTFSENMTVDTDSFTISCASSGVHAYTITDADPTFTLDPTTDFANSELCTVTVVATEVADDDASDPPDGLAANFTFTFTTVAAGDAAPTVTSTTPTDNATDVARTANISVNFSEAVAVNGSWFTIQCSSSGAHTATVTGGPTSYTLDPTTDFVFGEDCDVTIVALQVSDTDANDPPDNLAADYTFGFATSTPFTPINQIQGSGRDAALLGAQTTEGIVTARIGTGFYIQSAADADDGNSATSDGIFVFTNTAPPANAAIGARVRVSGTVTDFKPSQDPFQLPLTEFTFVTVTVVDAGPLALPTPVDLSAFAPTAAGGLDQLERFEGMRVTVPTFVVAAPSGSAEYNGSSSNGTFFGVVSGTPRPFRQPGVDIHQPLPAGTTATAVPFWDANPELIRVRSTLQTGATLIDVPAGTTITGLTGIMDYGFRRYTILPDAGQSPAPTIGTLPTGQAVSAPGANDITIGSYNIACGTGASCPTSRPKVSIGVRDFLRTPDILGFIEVSSQTVLNSFVTQINNDALAATGSNPLYVGHVESAATQSVGVIFKTAEIAPGVPRVAVNVNDIIHVGTTELLECPDGTPTDDLLNDRPPMIVPATINSVGKPPFAVTVIVNHPKSLIGVDDETTYPPGDDFECFGTVGARNREKRLQQSEFLAAFLDARQQANPNEAVVLVGDFNAFQFNDGYVDVIGTTTGNPTPDNQTVQPADGDDLLEPSYFDIVDTAPAPGPYSYVFGGNAQVLDHIIVNDAVIAATSAVEVEFAHINADYRRQADAANAATALRASDHDPVLAFLTQALPPTISNIGDQIGTEDTSIDNIPFTIADADGTVTCANVTGSASAEIPVPDPNIQITNGPGPGDCFLRLVPFPNSTGSSTITLTLTDSDGLTAADSFTVTINEGNNDAPSVVAPNDATIAEDTVFGPVSVAVGDVDSDSSTLTLTGASSNDAVVPDGSVVITAGATGSSRNLTITPAPDQSGTTTITLTVTDTGGAFSTDTFELTVTGTNDAPTISAIGDATIAEDATFGPTAFTVGDAETAVTCANVTAASSDTALVPLAAIDIDGAAQSCTVTITPAANASGSSTITLSLSDGTASVDEVFILTVTAANDVPTISDVADQGTNEDTPTGAIAFTVGDIEDAAGTLVVTGTSSNPAIVTNANIVIGGSGANRTVTLTPEANATGTTTITLTVTDANNATATDTFVLTVGGVNDSPTISDTGPQFTNEDVATGAIPFTIGDTETAATALVVTATSSNQALVPDGNIVLGGSGANRTVTLTPLANANGATTITLTVSDGNGGAATDTFILAVASVNDGPAITAIADLTIDEDGTTGPLAFTISDIDHPLDCDDVAFSSSNDLVVPEANIVIGGGTGQSCTITATPLANATGTTVIEVSIADGAGGFAAEAFTLTVAASDNDPPTLGPPPNQVTPLNTPTGTVFFSIGDPESDPTLLVVTATSSNQNLVPNANIELGGSGGTRSIRIVPVNGIAGQTTITLTVSDPDGGSVSASFTLNVTGDLLFSNGFE